ncbi:hypothetical protein [Eubacterium sp. AB3007]|uniref:hypothetical protein n=1 Tax=Eubacterium sp. AB3007 TaxID=1392487 RepID=UPI00048845EB|nr:hypothetical protein [Eubacterium sp. AB3007]
MEHKVMISVSEKPQSDGVFACRNVTIRERLLRYLFGDRRKVTILVPGDSVGEIAICKSERGGDQYGEGQDHA